MFGGTARERIQFDEATVWTSGPRSYARAGAAEVLATQRFESDPVRQRAYQAFGELHLAFPGLDPTAVAD